MNNITHIKSIKELPDTCIIFLLCTWSNSEVYLQHLLSQTQVYQKLSVKIINIDDEVFDTFKKQFNIISHGNSETFWIHQNKIIFQIPDYKKDYTFVHNYIEQYLQLL